MSKDSKGDKKAGGEGEKKADRGFRDALANFATQLERLDNPLTWAASGWGSLGPAFDTSAFQGLDTSVFQRQLDLAKEVSDLRGKVDEQGRALQAQKLDSADKQKQVQGLKDTLRKLSEKKELSFLLSRVNKEAQGALLDTPQFREQFLSNKESNMFVMSIDIRRSTELMLKARRANQFADFITILCRDLVNIVLESYGVLDKFTGDGILAFFPDFYSGSDAGYYALLAAQKCHEAFKARYREHRRAFNSVLKDTGLGIGIDYGTAQLVQMAGGLTVVGSPVVYACRMSGAPAGLTLLNQPAYERISERFSPHCFIREMEIEIKHEGRTVAYEVNLSKSDYTPQRPDWRSSAVAKASRLGGEENDF